MIGPICIDDLYFRLRRVSPLFAEIIAHESEIRNAHRKAVFAVVGGDLLVAHGNESLYLRNVLRLHLCARERCGLFEGYFRTFNGIDQVFFDADKFFVRNSADRVNFRAFDERAVFLRKQLNALRRAVRALIVLPVEKGDGKYFISLADGKRFAIDVVHGRFGKHIYDRAFQFRFADALRVVTDNFAQVFYADAQLRRKVAPRLFRLQIFFFLNVYSVNHKILPYLTYLMPMSVL